MRILGFESSAKTASVAVCDESGLISQYYQNSGLTHSRTLLPMAEDMLKNLSLTVDDIDLFAVAHGPGSFTGIRIGVATVKGLAWAKDKPVCGVSTLQALACNGEVMPDESLICCVMDARRGQYYNALFEMRDGLPVRLCADRAIGAAKLAEDIENQKKRVFIVGDGALLCYNTLENLKANVVLAPEVLRFQSAWGVCVAAARAPWQSVHELLPVYLRMSQAERARRESAVGHAVHTEKQGGSA
ncbi:MAG: tRNA (adenosine(37)-N6)-threonylcarbamoyltransferase complex dimerization subunit type 1 TsaB [Oscillospiraceae bacterium]|jgi:tRNA threonylcarbamoyladenosine biosynthesis protein TsaB|nr:tRNA (adenosine(37)-N6)-threonylcarbamoyltransferase complex dimerization subunit type 1 TsaB [Oscillospiraceae bacterium]